MSYPIILIAAAAVVGIVYYVLTRNQKKLKQLRQEWDKGTFPPFNEDVESVSSYFKNKQASGAFDEYVDQWTWDDLDMQTVYETLKYTKSSVGSEYLFNQLREIDPSLEHVKDKEDLYTLLANDQNLREKVQLILLKLGKRNFADTSAYFYTFNDQKIKHAWLYVILACLPIASAILIFFHTELGIASLFASFVINSIVYYKNKQLVENHLYSITYAATIVNAGKSLASVNHPRLAVFNHIFKGRDKGLRQTSFWGKTLSIGATGSGEFDVLFEYVRIIFLLDFIAYNQIVKTIASHRKAYQQLWESIGELDAGIAVAFYRNSLAYYTTPEFVDEETLVFEDMKHPLLDDPVTNTSNLGKSVLITGSNASGKSTYIKAVAINAILAQTINTALAKSWTMKPSYIVTSMAIEDNVLDGDSYFIAEIKSLQRIIRLSQNEKPMIAFIDEILKGTNTIERISASAAMMEWLAVHQGMTLIASHDIELTEIAAGLYSNYHFRETIEADNVSFDYKIHDGPSRTRNAIKLLEILNYPESVTAQANHLAQQFSAEGEWEVISGEVK